MSNTPHHCCSSGGGVTDVYQTLDELDFERGIWYAAQNNDLQRVQKLLTQGTSVDTRDRAGYTALHYAARAGHIEMCKFLLSNGSDMNARTRSGQATPLHRAASAGKYEIVKLLMDRNADTLLKDSDGKTVLHRAAESQHLAICHEICKQWPVLRKVKDNRGFVPFHYIRNTEIAAAQFLNDS